MIKTILPGVSSIGWVDSRHVPKNSQLISLAGLKPLLLTDVNPIIFVGEPECYKNSETAEGQAKETATLSFRTCEPLPELHDASFVVEDNNGDSWLIGSHEAPYPVVNCEQQAGQTDGEPAGYAYEVTHTAIKTLIRLIV